jgi:transcriptional antiterminator NusG
MSILTIRTTVGREGAVVDTLGNKVKNTGVAIATILHPDELKGYVFIEGDPNVIEAMIQGVPHIRGLIRKEVKVEELKKFLEVRKLEIKINRGDIVEVTGGPFKNEKGRVTRVDEAKSEVTIELLEAAIPIPITISTDTVKIIESAEKAAAKEASK